MKKIFVFLFTVSVVCCASLEKSHAQATTLGAVISESINHMRAGTFNVAGDDLSPYFPALFYDFAVSVAGNQHFTAWGPKSNCNSGFDMGNLFLDSVTLQFIGKKYFLKAPVTCYMASNTEATGNTLTVGSNSGSLSNTVAGFFTVTFKNSGGTVLHSFIIKNNLPATLMSQKSFGGRTFREYLVTGVVDTADPTKVITLTFTQTYNSPKVGG